MWGEQVSEGDERLEPTDHRCLKSLTGSTLRWLPQALGHADPSMLLPK